MTPAADLAPRRRIGRVALGDVLHRAARRFGARTALIEGGHRTSFRTLDEDANRMAHALTASGLVAGDRVAMLCDNLAEMVIAMFGIYKAWLVWAPVNTSLAPEAAGLISYVRDRPVADGLNCIATWNAAMLYSEDLDEARRAARERRTPTFRD